MPGRFDRAFFVRRAGSRLGFGWLARYLIIVVRLKPCS